MASSKTHTASGRNQSRKHSDQTLRVTLKLLLCCSLECRVTNMPAARAVLLPQRRRLRGRSSD
jgi:hypothetical protein